MQEPFTKKPKLEKQFSKFAEYFDNIVGSPYWFAFSVSIVLTWFISGFFVGFGDTWQLMINTTTTILTFLMISLLHTSEKKWEQRIERLEKREATNISNLEKKVSSDTTPSTQPTKIEVEHE